MNNSYRDQLELLIRLRDERLASAKTDAERASMTPQIIALSKQIESLTEKCIRHDVKMGSTLERDTIERFARELLAIIADEMQGLPDLRDWDRQAVNLFHEIWPRDANPTAYVADVIRELAANVPDHFTVSQNIARRVHEMVEGLKNEAPKHSD